MYTAVGLQKGWKQNCISSLLLSGTCFQMCLIKIMVYSASIKKGCAFIFNFNVIFDCYKNFLW